MRVTRRTVLGASLLGAAGALGTRPTVAQSPPAGPTSAERERLAHLAADLMDWYEAPALSVAIATKGTPLYVEAFGFADKERQETPHYAAPLSNSQRHQTHHVSRDSTADAVRQAPFN
jgi:CubicO group peptidase (beta-lactamase class C family)